MADDKNILIGIGIILALAFLWPGGYLNNLFAVFYSPSCNFITNAGGNYQSGTWISVDSNGDGQLEGFGYSTSTSRTFSPSYFLVFTPEGYGVYKDAVSSSKVYVTLFVVSDNTINQQGSGKVYVSSLGSEAELSCPTQQPTCNNGETSCDSNRLVPCVNNEWGNPSNKQIGICGVQCLIDANCEQFESCISDVCVFEQQNAIDSLLSQVDLNTISISELASKINNLDLTVNQQADLINQLGLSLSQQASLISSLQSNTANQAILISGLQTSVSNIASLIESLQTTTSGQAEIISNLQTTLDSKGQIIDKLRSDLDLSTSQLTDLINQVETQANNQGVLISQLQITTSQLADLISGLQTTAEGQGQLISGLRTDLNTQASIINELQETTSGQAILINNLGLNIDDLTTLTSQLNTDVETLRTQLNETQTQIQNIQTQLNQTINQTSEQTETTEFDWNQFFSDNKIWLIIGGVILVFAILLIPRK